MSACHPDAQLLLRGKIQAILAFYDQCAASECWTCRCKWDISLFLKLLHSAAQQCRRAILHPFVHSPSQGAFCSDLTTWSVLHYHWCRMRLELRSNHCCQINPISKIYFKIFLSRSDYLNYFDCLATYVPTSNLIDRPSLAWQPACETVWWTRCIELNARRTEVIPPRYWLELLYDFQVISELKLRGQRLSPHAGLTHVSAGASTGAGWMPLQSLWVSFKTFEGNQNKQEAMRQRFPEKKLFHQVSI